MTYKTVYLHRVVAEQNINRKLRTGEVVHHLDEDKSNNSPENLVICSSPSVHGRYHVRSLRQKLEADRPLIKVGDLWL
ncbi:HNH endonuclease [Microcoleus sp. N3A4]|uniref:HNH endonuclease n=1 Tax=Microcoleus sp. N3A4 TaxID=3055379 RepID=UPI002FD67083